MQLLPGRHTSRRRSRMAHKVRKHAWKKNTLVVEEKELPSAREAMDYAYALDLSLYIAIKVYDEIDRLIHVVEMNAEGPSYA